ncbi:hypothetical protein AGABI1DRAFT_122321 [Agaricus bisporus var. burnettii JB137-S8]|uniref:ERCC4 domain-containing protein n=1 Tax=Agaricus bisporus var. burnettii (strain JB137-S8 / ATCC MYA-4627 / FGSC 10392) TaxID=597362 RepID=K5WP66_AGABU|nr:uncharacterized protein AGABI1DRAFT_122321 [Agaricus bisporus var. burnettii JB137-S8]EKM77091.1 hypothetical protein AGABI1DRAFT_122321 [Agaricus bisporus var. burnettii JB137-S8]
MSTLLPFHKSILEEIHDPATSDLLILARGLGLRRIICTLMKIYDSNKNLILLVNATQEEESAIGEELGIMGCRRPGLRVIGYETSSKDRQNLYKQGGLMSVTSRILVVDMLQNDIPVHLITGMLILHAERVTPTVIEAFIVRLFREKNRDGFVKAFTDQPEHITSGMSPLKNVMKELQLRRAHLYPRFHEHINKTLERRRADVVELSQPLSQSMSEIHHAIIQCISTTLAELKRSNKELELDDFNVENTYFRSFEGIVRSRLSPVWHKVGPKTKQLINDLNVLRQLLFYLLSYDALSFHAYLETIIESNTISTRTGGPKVHQSPWLLTDAANIIFEVAKRRCFIISSIPKETAVTHQPMEVDDQDAWDLLDELEQPGTNNQGKRKLHERPAWLPKNIQPVLEEQPKWDLLSEILLEIESEIIHLSSNKNTSQRGTDTVLIMTSSTRSCDLIQDFLDTMDPDAESGWKGRVMMRRRLKGYLGWRGRLNPNDNNNFAPTNQAGSAGMTSRKGKEREDNLSEALKKKDREKMEKSASRRRTRGGAPSTGGGRSATSDKASPEVIDVDKPDDMTLWSKDDPDLAATLMNASNDFALDLLTQDEFESSYGLLPPEQTIVIRACSDDTDDRMLAEIQPRFIVMFEPSVEFIRRVEVYRSSYPGMAVRVYHMVYADSCEEHRYLAAIRKEKESFERLVKERGSMLLTLEERRKPGGGGEGENVIRTISTRLAGGRRELTTEPPKIIVDMREFRSALPSLLHAAQLLVVPATLTVGDYILTPDICVERKSLSDLVSSFNSGRLYTQCEFMSVHYKHPVLLIEFEEDKSFSLETISELKNYAKPTQKYPNKPSRPSTFNSLSSEPPSSVTTIQSKLVLLTLSFPRLRTIWSQSPYATAEIFKDLKSNQPEPDPIKAITIGADGDDPNDVGKGFNTVAEELVRALPGIGSGGLASSSGIVNTVMRRCKNVRELCELKEDEVKELVGVGPGKVLYEFLHKGE